MQTLPSRIDNPKNRKQKLSNDVLDLHVFDQNSMVFKHSEVASVGEQVVQALTTMAWNEANVMHVLAQQCFNGSQQQ